MKTKTYDMKKLSKWKFLFAGILLTVGILLIIFKPGYSLGQLQVSNCLIVAGIILIIFGLKGLFSGGKIKHDERTQMIILKSSKATLTTLIYVLLAMIVIGTAQRIAIDLVLFSSVTFFTIIIVYKLYYWHFNKKN